MITPRASAVLCGIFILTAYGVLVSLLTDSPLTIFVFESVSGLAVIAISVLLYPWLKPAGQTLALGYLVGKVLEGSFLILAAFLIFSNTTMLSAIRDFIFSYHAYLFIAASSLLYLLLYRSTLVPTSISIWGLVSLALLLIGNLLNLLGVTHPLVAVFYPSIMLNEIFLAGWLIVKGFNERALQVNPG
ncbi:MAG: DUF4386 family protein [Reinekea sp.]|nr:DUF4386 family protein [Reinekea sp.]